MNRWIIPAGAIEPGEDPVTAAIREVEEEVLRYFLVSKLFLNFSTKDAQTKVIQMF